ncbi:hypothetical protein WMY93_016609 [Mugilogobius chulae]|uniref:non-specific serine/threonine protein kinase n=1 Tax=Mugilogobius chulae TaxID=88201 RepID=A0AAW0NW35_9GOBI
MPPKAKAATGGKGKGRAPAKRKLAEEFPPGEVLTDNAKKSWKLGAPIGQGGFGLIYLADENSAKPVGSDARYVIKVLDTLEYIHKHEYVHADIKASNLMLSYSDPSQVYLVDYGLAYRYCPEGVQKEYKEDPKRCHDGTIEFTSIDAHKGASNPSRRADLEILGYCLVQWLCGRLPWEDKLQDPSTCRDNISEFMKKCFPSQDKPEELQKYMEEVKTLGYQDQPPYDKLRSILQTGLKTLQLKDDGKLEFGTVNRTATPQPVLVFLFLSLSFSVHMEDSTGDMVVASRGVTRPRRWLLYAIIPPICSPQRALHSDHEVAIVKMETKMESGGGPGEGNQTETKEEDSIDGEESPVKKKRVYKKKEVNGVKKSPVKSPKPKKHFLNSQKWPRRLHQDSPKSPEADLRKPHLKLLAPFVLL